MRYVKVEGGYSCPGALIVPYDRRVTILGLKLSTLTGIQIRMIIAELRSTNLFSFGNSGIIVLHSTMKQKWIGYLINVDGKLFDAYTPDCLATY
jgi:hypothetical protein